MNPRDFLDTADDLASGSREADWRSAASRAYYAAFHAGRELLRQCGFVVPRADTAHAYVWMRLGNSGHPDLADASDQLNELPGLRNRADYDLDRPFLETDGVDAVQSALDVVQLFESVSDVPSVMDRITATMRDYERDVLKAVTWQPPAP
jgi:uncharacterized protein (UPF0332 family)